MERVDVDSDLPASDAVDLVDDLEEEPFDEPGRAETAFNELSDRAQDAGIELSRHDYEESEGFVVQIAFPAGRTTRNVSVSWRRIDELIRLPFEHVNFVGDYDAIATYSAGAVEGAVSLTRGTFFVPTTSVFRRLFGLRDIDRNNLPTLTLEGDDPSTRIEFGPASDLLRVLVGRVGSRVSLRVVSPTVQSHDKAERALETAANSVFFDIDAKYGYPLTISRARSRLRPPTRPRAGPDQVRFPRSRFDPEPMALFFYARGARGMPLLQFLALYQCVEFYFEYFAREEALKRVGTIIRNPAFNAHSDRDISKLLGTLAGSPRTPFGSERQLVKTTLRAALHRDDLEAFFAELAPEERNTFTKKTSLTDVKIPIANAQSDLHEAVGDRIYDLRCKIVHSKESGPQDVIFPFSKEEDALDPDIQLLEFVARHLLAQRSQPFDL